VAIVNNRTVTIPRDTEAWAAIRALQLELETLRKSYTAHLSHAHGVFGSDAIKRQGPGWDYDNTTYVHIHEKMEHGQEQGSDGGTTPSDHEDQHSGPASHADDAYLRTHSAPAGQA
jgi:hypothetical protein